jgi:hypothetical protein
MKEKKIFYSPICDEFIHSTINGKNQLYVFCKNKMVLLHHKSFTQGLSKAAIGIGLVAAGGLVGGLAVMPTLGQENAMIETAKFVRYSGLARTLSVAQRDRWKTVLGRLYDDSRLLHTEQTVGGLLRNIAGRLEKYQDTPMMGDLNRRMHYRLLNMHSDVEDRITGLQHQLHHKIRPTPYELMAIRTRPFTPLLLSRTNTALGFTGLNRDQQIGRMLMSYDRIREMMLRDLQEYQTRILEPLQQLTALSLTENPYTRHVPQQILHIMEHLAFSDNFGDALVQTRHQLTSVLDRISWHDNLYRHLLPLGEDDPFPDELVSRRESYAADVHVDWEWQRANFSPRIITPQSLARYHIDPYSLLLPPEFDFDSFPIQFLRRRDEFHMTSFRRWRAFVTRFMRAYRKLYGGGRGI